MVAQKGCFEQILLEQVRAALSAASFDERSKRLVESSTIRIWERTTLPNANRHWGHVVLECLVTDH